MTQTIFGVKINSKKELNSALIKEEIGHIHNSEINLFETEFVTEEAIERGSSIAFNTFAEMEKQRQKP